MPTKIFNTSFENMLRVLLLLDCEKTPLSADRITYIDFICLYGKDYDVLEQNINGDNRFGLAEFTNKTLVIKEAISKAVRNNYIKVCVTPKGLAYEINERGRAIVEDIKSLQFSKKYSSGAQLLLTKFKKEDDTSLLSIIQNKALELEVN